VVSGAPGRPRQTLGGRRRLRFGLAMALLVSWPGTSAPWDRGQKDAAVAGGREAAPAFAVGPLHWNWDFPRLPPRLLPRLLRWLSRHSQGAARTFCGAASYRPLRKGGAFAKVHKLAKQLRAALPSRARPLPAGQSVEQRRLFSPAGEPSDSPSDFFLFIKDYGWGLRYRISRLANSILDPKRPLRLDWVKLRRPVRDPKELLQSSSEELFNWDVLRPPKHKGFNYEVTRAVDSGVEAVINFLDGRGLSLFLRPDKIEIVEKEGSVAKVQAARAGTEEPHHPVTHCWVQCLGMPLLPIVQSVSFFHAQEVVAQWQA